MNRLEDHAVAPRAIDELAALWDECLEKYNASTKRKLWKDRDKIMTFDDLNAEVEQSGQGFANAYGKHSAIWDTLESVSKPVIALSSVAQSAVGLTPFAPASLVFGAARYLIKSAQKVKGSYDQISAVFDDIDDAFQRIAEYSKDSLDPGLRLKVGKIFCKSIELIGESERSITGSGVAMTFLGRMLGADDNVATLKEELERIAVAEHRLAGAKIYSETRQTGKKMDKVLVQSKRTREREERQKLDGLLQAKTYDRVHSLHTKVKCVKNTGLWLLHHDKIRDWAAGRTAILSLRGPGGVGKSHLAKTMIEDLKARIGDSMTRGPNITVADYYVLENDEESKDADTMLKTIALQLTRSDASFQSFVLRKCGDMDRIGPENMWEYLFEPYFGADSCSSSLFIVVDAVDSMNSEQQDAFFKVVEMIDLLSRRYSPPRVHIVFTGRPEIYKEGRSYGILLEITPDMTKEDVRLYIEDKIKHTEVMRSTIGTREHIELMEEIQAKLVGTGFLFLWVKLILDEISECERPSQVRDVLDCPSEPYAVIDKIVDRLTAQTKNQRTLDDLNLMLTWIVYARQDLALGEISFLLKLKKPVGEGMRNRRLEDCLRSKYGSFFTVTRADSLTTEDLQQRAFMKSRYRMSVDLKGRGSKGPFMARSKKHSLDAKNMEAYYIEEVEEAAEEFDTEEATSPDTFGKSIPETEQDSWLSDPLTTTVDVSHGIISDYFHYTQAVGGEIGIDWDLSQYEITKTCLEILIDWIPKVKRAEWPEPNLSDYAAIYVLHHLDNIEPSRLNDFQQAAIIKRVACLFLDRQCISRWLRNHPWPEDLVEDLFSTNPESFAGTVLRWLRLDLNENRFTQWECLAISELSSSVTALLSCFARTVAWQWLEVKSPVIESGDSVAFLERFRRIALDSEDQFARTGFWCTQLGVDQITLLANMFYAPPYTAEWHERLASALQEAHHYTSSLEELKITVKMDPTKDDAKWKLAWIFHEVGEKEHAFSIAQVVWKDLPPTTHVEDESAWLHGLAYWGRELFDFKEAIPAARRWFSLLPYESDAFIELVSALHESRQFEAMGTLLVRMKGTKSKSDEHDNLSIQIRRSSVHVLIIESLEFLAMQDSAFPSTRYTDLTDSSESWLSFGCKIFEDACAIEQGSGIESDGFLEEFFRIFIGITLWTTRESIDELEALLRRRWYPELEKDDPDDLIAASFGMMMLANMYQEEALDAIESSPPKALQLILDKVETLAKVNEITEFNYAWKCLSRFSLWVPRPFSMVLAVVHGRLGHRRKSKALIQPSILEALDMLSDDTPKNDAAGFWKLGTLLLSSGDKQNGLTAYAVAMMAFEKEKNRYVDTFKRLEKRRSSSSQAKDMKLEDLLDTGPPSRSPPEKKNIEGGTFRDPTPSSMDWPDPNGVRLRKLPGVLQLSDAYIPGISDRPDFLPTNTFLGSVRPIHEATSGVLSVVRKVPAPMAGSLPLGQYHPQEQYPVPIQNGQQSYAPPVHRPGMGYSPQQAHYPSPTEYSQPMQYPVSAQHYPPAASQYPVPSLDSPQTQRPSDSQDPDKGPVNHPQRRLSQGGRRSSVPEQYQLPNSKQPQPPSRADLSTPELSRLEKGQLRKIRPEVNQQQPERSQAIANTRLPRQNIPQRHDSIQEQSLPVQEQYPSISERRYVPVGNYPPAQPYLGLEQQRHYPPAQLLSVQGQGPYPPAQTFPPQGQGHYAFPQPYATSHPLGQSVPYYSPNSYIPSGTQQPAPAQFYIPSSHPPPPIWQQQPQYVPTQPPPQHYQFSSSFQSQSQPYPSSQPPSQWPTSPSLPSLSTEPLDFTQMPTRIFMPESDSDSANDDPDGDLPYSDAENSDEDDDDYEPLGSELIDIVCWGHCGRRPEIFNEIYECTICALRFFCDVCYKKNREQTHYHQQGPSSSNNAAVSVGTRIWLRSSVYKCVSKHPLVRIYPVDPEHAASKAVEMVDGTWVPRKEWVDKLRAEWSRDFSEPKDLKGSKKDGPRDFKRRLSQMGRTKSKRDAAGGEKKGGGKSVEDHAEKSGKVAIAGGLDGSMHGKQTESKADKILGRNDFEPMTGKRASIVRFTGDDREMETTGQMNREQETKTDKRHSFKEFVNKFKSSRE